MVYSSKKQELYKFLKDRKLVAATESEFSKLFDTIGYQDQIFNELKSGGFYAGSKGQFLDEFSTISRSDLESLSANEIFTEKDGKKSTVTSQVGNFAESMDPGAKLNSYIRELSNSPQFDDKSRQRVQGAGVRAATPSDPSKFKGFELYDRNNGEVISKFDYSLTSYGERQNALQSAMGDLLTWAQSKGPSDIEPQGPGLDYQKLYGTITEQTKQRSAQVLALQAQYSFPTRQGELTNMTLGEGQTIEGRMRPDLDPANLTTQDPEEGMKGTLPRDATAKASVFGQNQVGYVYANGLYNSGNYSLDNALSEYEGKKIIDSEGREQVVKSAKKQEAESGAMEIVLEYEKGGSDKVFQEEGIEKIALGNLYDISKIRDDFDPSLEQTIMDDPDRLYGEGSVGNLDAFKSNDPEYVFNDFKVKVDALMSLNDMGDEELVSQATEYANNILKNIPLSASTKSFVGDVYDASLGKTIKKQFSSRDEYFTYLVNRYLQEANPRYGQTSELSTLRDNVFNAGEGNPYMHGYTFKLNNSDYTIAEVLKHTSKSGEYNIALANKPVGEARGIFEGVESYNLYDRNIWERFRDNVTLKDERALVEEQERMDDVQGELKKYYDYYQDAFSAAYLSGEVDLARDFYRTLKNIERNSVGIVDSETMEFFKELEYVQDWKEDDFESKPLTLQAIGNIKNTLGGSAYKAVVGTIGLAGYAMNWSDENKFADDIIEWSGKMHKAGNLRTDNLTSDYFSSPVYGSSLEYEGYKVYVDETGRPTNVYTSELGHVSEAEKRKVLDQISKDESFEEREVKSREWYNPSLAGTVGSLTRVSSDLAVLAAGGGIGSGLTRGALKALPKAAQYSTQLINAAMPKVIGTSIIAGQQYNDLREYALQAGFSEDEANNYAGRVGLAIGFTNMAFGGLEKGLVGGGYRSMTPTVTAAASKLAPEQVMKNVVKGQTARFLKSGVIEGAKETFEEVVLENLVQSGYHGYAAARSDNKIEEHTRTADEIYETVLVSFITGFAGGGRSVTGEISNLKNAQQFELDELLFPAAKNINASKKAVERLVADGVITSKVGIDLNKNLEYAHRAYENMSPRVKDKESINLIYSNEMASQRLEAQAARERNPKRKKRIENKVEKLQTINSTITGLQEVYDTGDSAYVLNGELVSKDEILSFFDNNNPKTFKRTQYQVINDPNVASEIQDITSESLGSPLAQSDIMSSLKSEYDTSRIKKGKSKSQQKIDDIKSEIDDADGVSRSMQNARQKDGSYLFSVKPPEGLESEVVKTEAGETYKVTKEAGDEFITKLNQFKVEKGAEASAEIEESKARQITANSLMAKTKLTKEDLSEIKEGYDNILASLNAELSELQSGKKQKDGSYFFKKRPKIGRVTPSRNIFNYTTGYTMSESDFEEAVENRKRNIEYFSKGSELAISDSSQEFDSRSNLAYSQVGALINAGKKQRALEVYSDYVLTAGDYNAFSESSINQEFEEEIVNTGVLKVTLESKKAPAELTEKIKEVREAERVRYSAIAYHKKIYIPGPNARKALKGAKSEFANKDGIGVSNVKPPQELGYTYATVKIPFMSRPTDITFKGGFSLNQTKELYVFEDFDKYNSQFTENKNTFEALNNFSDARRNILGRADAATEQEEAAPATEEVAQEAPAEKVNIQPTDSSNPSFEEGSMQTFSVDGGVLEIGRVKGNKVFSILRLQVDESQRRKGKAGALLKAAISYTDGQISGVATNDASVSLNYKLGMRAKGDENLSLEETLAKRTEKSEDGTITMIVPSKKGVTEEAVTPAPVSEDQKQPPKKVVARKIEDKPRVDEFKEKLEQPFAEGAEVTIKTDTDLNRTRGVETTTFVQTILDEKGRPKTQNYKTYNSLEQLAENLDADMDAEANKPAVEQYADAKNKEIQLVEVRENKFEKSPNFGQRFATIIIDGKRVEVQLEEGFAGRRATDVNSLTAINKDIFGLSNKKAKAAAVISDRMVEAMAKRDGISKEEMYKKISFRRSPGGIPKTMNPASLLFQSDYSSRDSKITFTFFKNSKEFDDAVKAGLIEKDVSIESLDGKTAVFHQPDDASVSNFTYKGETILKGQGGALYPIVFKQDGDVQQPVWASTGEAAASGLVNLINESGVSNEDGVARMVLTTGSRTKNLSNSNSMEGVASIFSAFSNNPDFGITENTYKKSVVAAMKKAGIENNLTTKSSLDEIMTTIQVVSRPQNTNFQKRKDFNEQLITEILSRSNNNANSKFVKSMKSFFADTGYKLSVSSRRNLAIKKGDKGGLVNGFAYVLGEPIVRDLTSNGSGQAYAVIEVTRPEGVALDAPLVEAVADDAHGSYPFAIKTINPQSKVSVKFFDKTSPRENIVENPNKQGERFSDALSDLEQGRPRKSAHGKVFPGQAGVSSSILKMMTESPVAQETESQIVKSDIEESTNRMESQDGATSTVLDEDSEVVFHGSPTPLEGKTIKRGPSGAIFLTPNRRYAEIYSTDRGGEVTQTIISKQKKQNLFDLRNPKHIEKLKQGFLKNNEELEVEYDSKEDALRDYNNAIRSMREASEGGNGINDWATGSQFIDQMENAGFQGALFAERPEGVIDESAVISYALFDKQLPIMSREQTSTVLDEAKEMSVLPLPERFLLGYEEATGKSVSEKDKQSFLYKLGRKFKYQPGGVFVDMKQFKAVNNFTGTSARISVDPETGKPSLSVSDNVSETDVTKGKGKIIRVNLFKKSAGWKWTANFDGNTYENLDKIVSVKVGSKHIYTLNFDGAVPVTLKSYPKEPSEPRLKPTTRGSVHLGPIIGEITRNNITNPVYSTVTVFDPNDKATIDRLIERAQSRSNSAILPTQENYNNHQLKDVPESFVKFQENKGAVFSKHGRHIIFALENPDISTPLHEMAHVYENYLTNADKKVVMDFAGEKQWNRSVSEKFARGFEKYLAEGKAPSTNLKKIFESFKTWLTDIYNGITGSAIDIELNDGMRAIYATMLGGEVVSEKKPAPTKAKKAEPTVEVAEAPVSTEKLDSFKAEVKKVLASDKTLTAKKSALKTMVNRQAKGLNLVGKEGRFVDRLGKARSEMSMTNAINDFIKVAEKQAKVPGRMIVVNEAKELIKRIKEIDLATRRAEMSVKKRSVAMLRDIEAFLKENKISKENKVNAQILRRLKYVIGKKNPNTIARFEAYLNNIVKDAAYAEKFKNADGIRKKIKGKRKRDAVPGDIKAIANDFISLNIESVPNIDEYTQLGAIISAGMENSKMIKGEPRMPKTFNKSEVNAYVSKELARQRDKQAEELKQKLVDEGLDPKGLTMSQMKAALRGDQTTKKETTKELINNFNALFERLTPDVEAEIKNRGLGKQDAKLVKDFVAMDLNLLKDRAMVIKAANVLTNFLENGSLYGMSESVSYHTGRKNLLQDIEDGLKGAKRSKYNIIGKFDDRTARTFYSTLISVMGGTNKSNTFFNNSGSADLVKGSNSGEKTVNEYLNGFADLRDGSIRKAVFSLKLSKLPSLKKRKNNTYDQHVERAMYAHLDRIEEGSSKEEAFANNKRMLKESVEVLTKIDSKKGEAQQKVYDRIVKGSETIEDVVTKMNPDSLGLVSYWRDLYSKHFPELKRVTEQYYNKRLPNDQNYFPRSFITIDPTEFAEEAAQSYGAQRQARITLDTQKIKSLPKGKILNLDFDRVAYTRLREGLIDARTVESLKQIDGYVNSPEFIEIVNTKEQVERVRSRIDIYRRLKRNELGQPLDTDVESNKAVKKVFRTLTTVGMAKVMVQVSQSMKQYLTAMISATSQVGVSNIITKDIISVFNPYSEANKFIDRTSLSIINRGYGSRVEVGMEEKLSRSLSASQNLAFSGLDVIDSISTSALQLSVGFFDKMAARTAFLGFYKKKLKQMGLPHKNIDWASHELNEEAASFADIKVADTQNVSDEDMKGAFFTNKNSVARGLIKIFIPLSGFRLNARVRVNTSVKILASPATTIEDRRDAAANLVGTFNEMVSYVAIGYMMGRYLFAKAGDKLGFEDPNKCDEKVGALGFVMCKKDLDYIIGMYGGRFLNDLLNPFPPGDEQAIVLYNKALNLLSEKDEVDQEDLFRTFDTGGYNQMLGIAGVVFEDIEGMLEYQRLANTGEYIYEDEFGNKTVKKISPESQAVLQEYMVFNYFSPVREVRRYINNLVTHTKRMGEDNFYTDAFFEQTYGYVMEKHNLTVDQIKQYVTYEFDKFGNRKDGLNPEYELTENALANLKRNNPKEYQVYQDIQAAIEEAEKEYKFMKTMYKALNDYTTRQLYTIMMNDEEKFKEIKSKYGITKTQVTEEMQKLVLAEEAN